MGFIDWRDITNIIPGANGTTIWFTSDYTIWAFDNGVQRFRYNTYDSKWTTISDNIPQYDFTNSSYADLINLAKNTQYPIIGAAKWDGSLVPNAQNGFVFLANGTATLLSITGGIYRYNPDVKDTSWVRMN